MFRFAEPSSGQLSKHSKGTFSERAYSGIQYCLQIILPLKIMSILLADVFFKYTKKSSYPYIVLVKIFKKLEYVYIYIYILRVNKLLSGGIYTGCFRKNSKYFRRW